MKLSNKKAFFVVFAAFLLLGIPFKVMVLVEGLTEVRPVNAVPIIAGLAFGPVGALACGIGNLVADLFGSFGISSLLGILGNFVAAYLPYRVWHLFSKEKPNLHTFRAIGLYIVTCFLSAMTVSTILSFGLYYIGAGWIKEIYTYVFWNDFLFGTGLGMPVFIILTSDSVKLSCMDRPKRMLLGTNRVLRNFVCVLYTVSMTAILVGVLWLQAGPDANVWMQVLAGVSAVIGVLLLC